MRRIVLATLAALSLLGCGDDGFNLPSLDASFEDAGHDGGIATDAGEDSGMVASDAGDDSGQSMPDAGPTDLCGGCPSGEYCGTDSMCQTLPCDPTQRSGDFAYCFVRGDDSYAAAIRYLGDAELDTGAQEFAVAGEASVDLASGAGLVVAAGEDLTPGKYSLRLRLRDTAGARLRTFFLPLWVGTGGFADFRWTDASVYQVLTDRFADGDPSNNLDNSAGSLAEVADPRSQWQGGDYAGLLAKIREGYFEDLGINTLWISSPVLGSHSAQPGVDPGDPQRYSSYHGYHPVATGYSDTEDYGYADPVEDAFGTAAELHELIEEAHSRGMRIMPDFVANHVHIDAEIYRRHPEWFFPYNACHNRWDEARIGCWFTSAMPDFDYGSSPEAVSAVVDHALWLIQEFDFDAFRADALKHMDDVFVRALRTALANEIETSLGDDPHGPAAFYVVGESLGGWARYHVREDMVMGQVDEDYYRAVKASLLTFETPLRNLANFAVANDRAYLSERPTMGGAGGYADAIMGNFFGNHDQRRALSEAGGNTAEGHRRLRLAQTMLFTSPYNIPMLYQGDDIGTLGEQDPDNRAMMRFSGLSTEEQSSLAHAQRLGQLRRDHRAFHRGERANLRVDDYFWVFRVSGDGEDVYVAINRDADQRWSPPVGYSDALGNCSGGNVPSQQSCVFVAD